MRRVFPEQKGLQRAARGAETALVVEAGAPGGSPRGDRCCSCIALAPRDALGGTQTLLGTGRRNHTETVVGRKPPFLPEAEVGKKKKSGTKIFTSTVKDEFLCNASVCLGSNR